MIVLNKPALVMAVILFGFFAKAAAQNEAEVRVRLKRSLSSLSLNAQNLALAVKTSDVGLQNPPVLCKEKQTCEVYFSVKEGKISIRVGSQEVGRYSSLDLNGREIRMNSQRLPDQLRLHVAKGKLDLIGLVDLENYIVGVVSSEMPTSWPVETLKAQAVTARSYLLSTKKERKRLHFDVDADVFDQVYRHTNAESQASLVNVRKAVRATAGEVLTLNGKVLKSFYHSHCGGQTASAKKVWGAGNDAGQVQDPSCALSLNAKEGKTWVYRISKEELERKLQSYFKTQETVLFQVAELRADSGHGRTIDIPIHLVTQGQPRKKHMNGNEFRGLIGFDKLKSMNFKVQDLGRDWVFSGNGYGHGVGLCQWGSRRLGQHGLSYQEILNHYYPKAKRSLSASF